MAKAIEIHAAWMRENVAHRHEQIRACLAAGAPTFERVSLRGFSRRESRCQRCGRLERHHNEVKS